MPRFGFAIDHRACIGCHACTVACKSEHGVPLGVNRTWVRYIETGTFPHTRRHFTVQRCNHCDDAPCVEICPVTALFRRPDGIVDFDNTRCIGCKACMQACPYDALYLDPQTATAAKCNYCTHRVDAGYEPACVIVCPVHAIVSGDLDDPDSAISRLQRQERVYQPKPEKGTRPKLFYVGAPLAVLPPAAAPPTAQYLWSADDGPLPRASLDRAEQEARQQARRVYDPRSKPVAWGWMVSAYITTKALAAGVPIVAAALYALGRLSSVLPPAAALTSLLFLALTGILLVADLKQPRRFAYVLLRPQWRSWLVRGAYLITALGIALPLVWLLAAQNAPRPVQLGAGLLLSVLAAAAAVYTARLLAQARGRDSWQNPLLPTTMLADAIVAGLVVAVWLGWLPASAAAVADTRPAASAAASGAPPSATHPDPTRLALLGAVVILALLTAAEYIRSHRTRDAALAAEITTRGVLAGWFWIGAVGLGLLLPLVLLGGGLAVGGAAGLHPVLSVALHPAAAAAGLLAGVVARNHVLIRAPQYVPLS